MSDIPSIPYINFVTRVSKTLVDHNGIPILQLGFQTFKVPLSEVQGPSRQYYLVRIASTLGMNKFTIQRARVDVQLNGELRVSIHDMLPRREETINENAGEVEVGVDAAFSWGPVTVGPHIKYTTRRQKIDAYVRAGGLLAEYGWWEFRRRRGESQLAGIMETFMTIQASQGKTLHVAGILTARGKRLEHDTIEVKFRLE